MFDVNTLIQSGGLLLLAIIVFAEVGLLLGFFLPGDTLLIAAGIYAHAGHLSIVSVIAVVAVAAIVGDSTGYYIGRKLGPRVFNKPDGLIFRKDHIDKAEAFYEKYGAKTLLISHFLPFIRTFQPLLTGVSRMPYKRFVIYDVIGDIAWAISVPLLGYYVGSRIPGIDKYIQIVLVAVILLAAAPTILHVIKMKLKQRSSTPKKD
ncbi:MAG: DedA family protein [Patescibacteria group bacterium]|nr:DedA family protein [Patescibacteria group bacterium]